MPLAGQVDLGLETGNKKGTPYFYTNRVFSEKNQELSDVFFTVISWSANHLGKADFSII